VGVFCVADGLLEQAKIWAQLGQPNTTKKMKISIFRFLADPIGADPISIFSIKVHGVQWGKKTEKIGIFINIMFLGRF